MWKPGKKNKNYVLLKASFPKEHKKRRGDRGGRRQKKGSSKREREEVGSKLLKLLSSSV